MNKIITSICVTVALATLIFSALTMGSFAAQPPMQYSDGAHNCVFVTDGETGLSYWYEGGVRQGVLGDQKNVVFDGTERGREIYDPKTNAWFWLDVDRDGAKAVYKEVFIPYIYQDDAAVRINETELNSRAAACDAMNNSSGLGALLVQSIKDGTGKWVRYDGDGKMIKGWYTEDGSIVAEQKGQTYYYDQLTGLMANGWITIEGVRYHFNEVTGVLDDRVSEGSSGKSSNGSSGYGNNATSYDEFTNAMLAEVNALRRQQGVRELVLDEQCNAVGSVRAVEIATLFSHTRPNGRKFYTVWDDLGYGCSNVGENLNMIKGNYKAESLTQAAHDAYECLYNSPGHYANMIKAKWTKAYFNLYIVQDGEYTGYYCVQTFSK